MPRDPSAKKCLGFRRARRTPLLPEGTTSRRQANRRQSALTRDASGRLLQPTFQRRAPEPCMVSDICPTTGRVHAARFASPQPTSETTMAIHHPGPKGAEALTSPSSGEPRREIAIRQTRDRFHRQPVKIVGFRGPGRLPPASSPPQALPPSLVSSSRVLDVISPPSDLSPWARPPSPTPAATEVASLSQTPLTDFCNQNRARAHRPND
jgi:hypothetical protein